MKTNPYAPPVAEVADVDSAEDLLARRSKLVTIISVNAALFGLLVLVAGVVATVSRNAGGTIMGPLIVLACYALLILVAAIGLFRHRFWAANLWLVLSGLLVATQLVSLPSNPRKNLLAVGFLIVQFIGATLGVWVIARRRAAKAKLRPVAQIH